MSIKNISHITTENINNDRKHHVTQEELQLISGNSLPSGEYGNILIYTTSGWASFSNGPSGQFLQTNGLNEIPSWENIEIQNTLSGLSQGESGVEIYNGISGDYLLFSKLVAGENVNIEKNEDGSIGINITGHSYFNETFTSAGGTNITWLTGDSSNVLNVQHDLDSDISNVTLKNNSDFQTFYPVQYIDRNNIRLTFPFINTQVSGEWELFISKGGAYTPSSLNISPMGIWSVSGNYNYNNGVSFGGSYYRSLIDNNTENIPSADTINWEIMISKGDTGETNGIPYYISGEFTSGDLSGNNLIIDHTYGNIFLPNTILNNNNTNVYTDIIFLNNQINIDLSNLDISGTWKYIFG